MQIKDYEIKFHEVDCKNRLKETVLLNFFQDIAADNAEKIGVGYSKIQDKNIGWFLTKYHIKIFKSLKNEGKITLSTQSRGAIKITCFRDFDILNCNKEKIGEATSSWILADLKTGTIIPPSQVFEELPSVSRSELRSTFPKILQPKRIDFQKTFTATFNDLDVNQHVNNAIYLTWADDVLPLELLTSTRIEELEIQYKQQVKYNDKVIISAEFDEENNIITEELKKKDGEIVCSIRQKRIAEI